MSRTSERSRIAVEEHGTAVDDGSPWVMRLHGALSLAWWLVQLSVAWLGFSLAGGVLFGVAPASLAAATLARRRDRGDLPRPFVDFAVVWRTEFVAANLSLGPGFALTAWFWFGYLFLSGLGEGATAARLALLLGTALGATVLALAVPMAAHYDLPRHRVVVTALRFVFRQPGAALLLLAIGSVTVFVTVMVPLVGLVTIGAWWQGTTAIALRCFARNEELLTRPSTSSPGTSPVRWLPSEPLRMR